VCSSPRRWCKVSRATLWQESYLAQTHYSKTETTRNHPHQNVLVTWTKVKTLCKLQSSHILNKNPIWTYGIQIWGTASASNIEILERFQSKALRMIMDASWSVPNTVIRRDLQIPTVKEEVRRYGSQYIALLSSHPDDLIVNLFQLRDNRRLRKHLPNDLPIRFLVYLLYEGCPWNKVPNYFSQ
jgi:hypothetical protein